MFISVLILSIVLRNCYKSFLGKMHGSRQTRTIPKILILDYTTSFTRLLVLATARTFSHSPVDVATNILWQTQHGKQQPQIRQNQLYCVCLFQKVVVLMIHCIQKNANRGKNSDECADSIIAQSIFNIPVQWTLQLRNPSHIHLH